MTEACRRLGRQGRASGADRVIFMDAGVILEAGERKEFFSASKGERSRRFLGQILPK
jgi:ABC-type polar amino acid transport system ATPase subunit